MYKSKLIKYNKYSSSLLLSTLILALISEVNCGYSKVKLKDVQTLTLQKGQMTTGRRSSPVQQLQCIYGGSVDCSSVYLPSVQCYNRGFDGVDVQWECKADMDAAYKFGKIEVNCEGYDYPDDPYILAGSCGLEYNIDYSTDKKQGGSYGWNQKYTNTDYYSSYDKHGWDGKGWLVLAGLGIVVYAIYKTCIAGGPGGVRGADGRSTSNDDYPPDDQGRRRPPPPGFNFGSGSGGAGDSCGGGTTYSSAGTGTGTGGGGFWTGAATGGLLGYMFGRNNNGGYGTRGYGSGGGGWFGGGGGGGGFGGGSPQPSTSSGSGYTRSTSGYGGTRRR